MQDRLVSLLKWFSLRAHVFQTGALCRSALFEADDGLSYLHIVRNGGLRLETAGKAPLHITEPTLVFYMSPTTHRLVPTDGDTDTVCASFQFDGSLRNPLVSALPEVVVLPLSQLADLDATLRVLFAEASEVHCGRQAVLDRLTEVVIIQLLRDLMDKGRLDIGLLAGLADPQLLKAINAMHAAPAEPWTVESLAKQAGMSRARFAARFREKVGAPPLAYLGDYRVGIAQSMLRRGSSIQRAADATGYANASAFSRAFSALTGKSPRQWLNHHTDPN